MKKLSTLDLVMIPALVALTIVVRMTFKGIPGVEFTTPIFIALSVLLRRHISLYYLVLFLVVDSLIIQQGNTIYILINTIVWCVIYLLCQLVKSIKWQQTIFVFLTGLVAVLLQTLIWFVLLPIFAPKMAPSATFDMIIAAWVMDFATLHPIVAGSFAVTIYAVLSELVKTYRLNSLFDK